MTAVHQVNKIRNNNYIGGDSMLGKKLDVKVVAAIPYAGLYSGYYMVGNRRRNIYQYAGLYNEHDTHVQR